MKKIAVYVICFILLCGFVGCGTDEKYAGFNKNDFGVVEEKDTHGGFHGDGTYLLVLDCSKNKEKAMALIKDWNVLPLSKNLNIVLYGSDTYGSLLAEETDIPKITNGYYYFFDRHDKSTDYSDDTNLLSRASFNFTLAIYDSDTNKMYYVEFDT